MHAPTTGLALEFDRAGITVNTVPSYIKTRSWPPTWRPVRSGGRFLTVLDDAERLITMGRPDTVEDVAGVVAYLVGRDASFVIGQTVSINGGSSMS